MRHVFFSFHYADVWRAMQVRNMWVTEGKTAAGFVDSADFEVVQKQGEQAIRRWINKQLERTTVTVVLIGSQTLSRPYVQYEIDKSIDRGNGLVGIHINTLSDQNRETKSEPKVNTLLKAREDEIEHCAIFHSTTSNSTDYYNAVRKGIGKWIEDAAKDAGH